MLAAMADAHDAPAVHDDDHQDGAVAMGHDDHDDDHGHGAVAMGHDDHGDHGPADDAWVLLPLAVGLVIGVIIAIVFALQSAAPALT